MEDFDGPVDPLDLWKIFRDQFFENLKSHDETTLLSMWQSLGARTSFYSAVFMPQLAGRLKMVLKRERCRCDFSLESHREVPLVFVETENASATACNEIRNLCRLSAPLKVLILTCGWLRSEKARYQDPWSEIIRNHHSVVAMNCLYAIIAGEWHDGEPLVYSSTLLDVYGKEIETRKEEFTFAAGNDSARSDA